MRQLSSLLHNTAIGTYNITVCVVHHPVRELDHCRLQARPSEGRWKQGQNVSSGDINMREVTHASKSIGSDILYIRSDLQCCHGIIQLESTVAKVSNRIWNTYSACESGTIIESISSDICKPTTD